MAYPRTLIIGIDGATFDLIDPLMDGGSLPAFKRLVDEGARGVLQTWPDTNSAAAWSSMITGCNAGKHGVFNFGAALSRPGSPWKPVTGRDRLRDPFWRTLSASGQRVGVVNVPITYPADSINGFMISGMDTPGLNSPGITHPAGLIDELRSQRIEYLIDVPGLQSESRRDPGKLPRMVEEMIAARARTVFHLMETGNLDVLMAVFVATDRVQHYYWPNETESVDGHSWRPVRRVYELIDSFLAEVLERVGSETTILVVSDHGFGRTRRGKRLLNRLLAKLGLLRYREGGSRAGDRFLSSLLGIGRKVIPIGLRDGLARSMPSLHLRAVNQYHYSGIEWPATRAFASSTGRRVSINLKGRETEGAVHQDEYDSVREHVREILLGIVDPETGRPAVNDVVRREEVYSGPCLEMAADLVMRWNYEVLGDGLGYEADGELISVGPRDAIARGGNLWTGSHRNEGIFVARGPDIAHRTDLTPTILDIAPTIFYLQDHPVPGDVDGRVLSEIFSDERLQRQPVRSGEALATSVSASTREIGEADAQLIEDRLKSLGYLE